jgi:hypothetical protein
VCDSCGVFGPVEHEDEDEVPVVDLGDMSGTAAGIDDIPHRVLRHLDDLRRHRVAQMEMVHNDVHRPTVSGFRGDR